MERKYPPHAGVLDVDTTLKYTHGHGIPIPSFQGLLLTPDTVTHHSTLSGLNTGKPGRPLPPVGQQPSIQVAELPTKDQEELDSTISDLMSQLQTDLATGLVSTAVLPNIDFANADTDVVIVNTPLQIEAVEAEEDVIVTNEEIQQNPVPVVFNLANLFPQTDSSSSSASSSFSDNLSSGGIIGGSISSTSIANPVVLLFSYGLAAASVFALTLPFWVPFVVAKRRHASAPFRKKVYPLNKKKALIIPGHQTTNQPLMNHQQQQNNKLPYSNYDRSPLVTQRPTADIADGYRPGGSSDFSSEIGLHFGPYPDLVGNSLWTRSKDPLKDPGPLKLKGVYGPISNFFLKTARRNSNKRRLQKKNQ